jgi:hypothetical protein
VNPILAMEYMLLGVAIMLLTMYDISINMAYRPLLHAIGVISSVAVVLFGATYL